MQDASAGPRSGVPGGLRIEWCGPDDAEVMREVTAAAFAAQGRLEPPSGAVSETIEDVRRDLVGGRGVLAYAGATVVGACRVTVRSEPDRFHVRRLAVVPAMQRRGIARAVMRWLEHEAASEGMYEITLGVRNGLPQNFLLYEGLGYEHAGDHGFWTELRKPLRPPPGTPSPEDPDSTGCPDPSDAREAADAHNPSQ